MWRVVYEKPVHVHEEGIRYVSENFIVLVANSHEICLTRLPLEEEYDERRRLHYLARPKWHVDPNSLLVTPVTFGTTCFFETEPVFDTLSDALRYVKDRWEERLRDWEAQERNH